MFWSSSKLFNTIVLIGVVCGLIGCIAPRSVIESGRVTPHKHVRGGLGTTTNIPTAFPSALVKALSGGIGDLVNDTFVLDQNLNNVTNSILSYTLDPLTQTVDLYLRYGLVKNIDLGYKYTGGVHAFDGQLQLAGNEEHSLMDWNGWNSSLGVQYSGKKYELPKIFGDVQKWINFELGRKDVFAKFIMSRSIGENEKNGHFGFGLAYNHTFVNYGLKPSKVLAIAQSVGGKSVNTVVDALPNRRTNFGAYGGFVNLRVGYKHVFLYLAFSMYWQDYGNYSLFEGHNYHGKGMTYVPSLGLQIDI